MRQVLCLLMLLAVPQVSVAEMYKCNQNGKIVYADRPCGSSSEVIKPRFSSRSDQGRDSNKNHYSIDNQLRRIEQDQSELKIRRKNQIDEQARTKQQQLEAEKSRDMEQAECEYYRARVSEEEYNLRQGYQSQAHRKTDENYLNLLLKSVKEYCY